MIIQSEITGKSYNTVEECLEDEKAFKAEKEAAEKAKQEKQEKLEAAFNDICKAWKTYVQTYRDYGYRITPVDEYGLFLEVISHD